jgi:hypothetical protein
MKISYLIFVILTFSIVGYKIAKSRRYEKEKVLFSITARKHFTGLMVLYSILLSLYFGLAIFEILGIITGKNGIEDIYFFIPWIILFLAQLLIIIPKKYSFVEEGLAVVSYGKRIIKIYPWDQIKGAVLSNNKLRFKAGTTSENIEISVLLEENQTEIVEYLKDKIVINMK